MKQSRHLLCFRHKAMSWGSNSLPLTLRNRSYEGGSSRIKGEKVTIIYRMKAPRAQGVLFTSFTAAPSSACTAGLTCTLPGNAGT